MAVSTIEVESGVTVHIEGVQMKCGGENVSSASMSLRNLKAGKATGGWDIVWCLEGGGGWEGEVYTGVLFVLERWGGINSVKRGVLEIWGHETMVRGIYG